VSMLRGYILLGIAITGSVANAVTPASMIDVEAYHPLVSDRRAYQLGDPLVVLVDESTSAESSAGTDSMNDSGLRGQLAHGTSTHSAGLNLAGHDQEGGQTSRKGRASTQMSVNVTQVLPHGLLRVGGEHDLTINGEHQRVSVSGLVRADDIGKDNTVSSSRISEAHVVIVGSGDVDRARRPGLLARVRHWFGL
jgi:flagellar L-ring protein precursor FlgH